MIRLNQDKTTFVFPEFSIGTTPIGAVESVAARVESVAARQMSSSGLSASTGQPQTSSDLYYILLLAPSVLLHITFSSELHITYYIYYLVMGPKVVQIVGALLWVARRWRYALDLNHSDTHYNSSQVKTG